MTTKLELKKVLFDAYGGFADKRYKKLANDLPFIIDDRSERDHDARGQLYLWFCIMLAEVQDGSSIRVVLGGGIPQGSKRRASIARRTSRRSTRDTVRRPQPRWWIGSVFWPKHRAS